MWILVALFFFLTLASVVGLFFARTRSNAKWAAPLAFCGAIGTMGMALDDIKAGKRGYLSAREMREVQSAQADARKAAEDTERQVRLAIPTEQKRLIQAVEAARAQFKAGGNDLQRGAARPARARAICTAMPSPSIVGWVGTLHNLSTNSDGDGVVSIKIADGIYLKTWNNSFSDIGANTLIKPSSAAYTALLTMKIGAWVRISGELFPDGTDCFREASLTLAGSLTEPGFIVRFSRIERIDD